MSLNARCPRCGSEYTQLTSDKSGNGCLYFLLFGEGYLIWVLIKGIVGIVFFLLIDWWLWILFGIFGRGYIGVSGRCFSARKRTYFCHSCGNNFRA